MHDLLPGRKRQVLNLVVEEYIASGEPVGSAQVAQRKGIPFSSATARHVMAELEELGYLRRRHASSGVTPTNQGYRVYVDQLMKRRPISNTDKKQIMGKFDTHVIEFHELLKEACRVVSARTNQTSLGVFPKGTERNFEQIQFRRLRGNMVLALMVSSSGFVENKILKLDAPVPQNQLDQMHNYLNEHLAGLTIGGIRQKILLEMKGEQIRYNELLNRALLLGEQAFSDQPPEIHIEGQSRLFSYPDFNDVERMQQILRTLEEKTIMLRVLDQCLHSPGVQILIGDEVPGTETDDLTLVTSVYKDGEGNPGVLGVVGPTRINYARVVPLVDFTSQIITKILHEEA